MHAINVCLADVVHQFEAGPYMQSGMLIDHITITFVQYYRWARLFK